MKKHTPFLLLIGLLAFWACNDSSSSDLPVNQKLTFKPVAASFDHEGIVLPEGLEYQIIYQAGDSTVDVNGTVAPARDRHDFLAFIPLGITGDTAMLWTNHESHSTHETFTDGGGGTIIDLLRVDGKWQHRGMPRAADFSPVGGTVKNCLGAVTPWRTILTSEEWEPANNTVLFDSARGIRDTSDLNDWPRYLNYGWMVEVDPVSGHAIRKLWGMGRFMHEGAYCMGDRKTVYLLDDESPAVFFKFVAENSGDYSEGNLFAYRQHPDGKSGDWVKLPSERDSLAFAREMACKRGATMFVRLEDIEPHPDGGFLLTETGRDENDFSRYQGMGGRPANHLVEKFAADKGPFSDYYGRVLRFDPETNSMSVLLEAGKGKGDIFLSNPDNFSIDTRLKLMFIHEDINGLDQGRTAPGTEKLVNEIYVLDLNNPNPTVDDLQRFAIGALGCETTGPAWSSDYQTYFFNLQHPDPGNPAPFNRATTVAISGFKYPSLP